MHAAHHGQRYYTVTASVLPTASLGMTCAKHTVVSFLEFGARVLSVEGVWLVMASVRNKILQSLDGHLSHFLDLILSRFMFDGVGNDLERSGIILNIGDRTHMLTAGLGVLLADEPALREVLLNQGHAGFKCCALCKHVCLHRWRPALMTGPWTRAWIQRSSCCIRMNQFAGRWLGFTASPLACPRNMLMSFNLCMGLRTALAASCSLRV